MKHPEGFVAEGQEHLVCKLKRSIYALKQSSWSWNSVLDQNLKKLGFVPAVSDPCVYAASEGEMFLIADHMDDLVLAAKSDKRIDDVKKALGDKFEVKDIFWELKCCRTNKMETFGLDNQSTPKRSCVNLTWRMQRQ